MFTYLLLALAFLCMLYVRARSTLKLPFPPGPKPSSIPLIGNLFDVPFTFPWETYDKWFKEFRSEIIHLNAAGMHIIILNTYEAAMELLHKRSAFYSSRIRMTMLVELMGWDDFVVLPYGDRWRRHRRLFHQTFNETTVKTFQSQQAKAAHQLLLRLVDRPAEALYHIRHTVGSLLFSITYGIVTLPDNDPFLSHAERTVELAVTVAVPGAFWVDFLPWLKYVPRWVPGAKFRRIADAWNEMLQQMIRPPYEIAKQKISEGRNDSSFVSVSLSKMNEGSFHYGEEDIISVASIIFAGGSDTTIAMLSTFLLALVLHPEIQKKAQAEIDRVLKGSLPTFEDRESLPYVSAVLKEALRWKPVTPLGVPHCVISDDVYKGHRISSGSMVISNLWSMLYDEKVYPNPSTFNPERFLKDGKLDPAVRDPESIVFGFGRRICPGRHMALSFLWITAAHILATLDVTKAIDEHGNIIEPTCEYESAHIIQYVRLFERIPAPKKAVVQNHLRAVQVLGPAWKNLCAIDDC